MSVIMGSETELGLIPRGRAGIAEFLVEIEKNFGHSRHLNRKDVARVTKRFNRWKEDLSFTEEVDKDAGSADVVRRLGMSGDYLSNGARFYRDGWHLEYSTPECRDPWELVAHEKAGEAIVRFFVDEAERSLGHRADLLKRNSDYRGHSYACHLNFLTSRNLFAKIAPKDFVEKIEENDDSRFRSVEQALWTTHLISMQIFAGAGRIIQDVNWPDCFVLSQRQKYIKYFSALGTTESRSIINIRDRPYADPARFARLHVICCDSNRADWANILKYGTSALVLGMLEDFGGAAKESHRYLIPSNAVRDFCDLADKDSLIACISGSITALDAQRKLLELAGKWYRGTRKPGYDWAPRLFAMWENVLDCLERDDERSGLYSDYHLKKRIFEGLSDAQKTASVLQSLEYNYHLVRKDSLFRRLAENGETEVVVGDDRVKEATSTPPPTRAKLRSNLLKFLREKMTNVSRWNSWHEVGFGNKRGEIFVYMPDPASAHEHELFRENKSFLEKLFAKRRD